MLLTGGLLGMLLRRGHQVNKGELEETYRQLQEVVGMSSKDPIAHVVEEVTSAVTEKFGTVADHGDGVVGGIVDQSQISEAAPSVVAPAVVGNEGQDEIVGDKRIDDVSGVGGKGKEVPEEGKNGAGSENGAGEEESNRDRSVGKRALKPSSKVYSDEYICGNRKTSTLGSADTTLINYCRSWTSQSGSGPIMLQCDGEFACRDSCHDVLHSRRKVGTQYVCVVSKMYTKEWAIKYEGHSKRIMMHPAYGIKLVTDMDTPAVLAKKHGQPMRGVAASQLAVVFVPVVKEDHWWCAAFSFKEEKVWIIDSIFADPVAQHNEYLSKLVTAVDVLVKYHDQTWPEGSIGAWPIESLRVVQQPNLVCCGVVMLACIKDSTDRFRTRWQMDDVKSGRMQLLIEDLRSVCNERRQELDGLITKAHGR
ncbi:uncharacterized protein LOC110682392 [Chenopodium quinoa]|uniref:Ubiquitin-like protease family profile domain-containing protein n=1 Tax=Chenopodium quinoa TaxID=63459 RepID=A0A803KY59_CHEQI|nr:uncharacterized protein LOC110682392 [Chenopodium quinoa]